MALRCILAAGPAIPLHQRAGGGGGGLVSDVRHSSPRKQPIADRAPQSGFHWIMVSRSRCEQHASPRPSCVEGRPEQRGLSKGGQALRDKIEALNSRDSSLLEWALRPGSHSSCSLARRTDAREVTEEIDWSPPADSMRTATEALNRYSSGSVNH